MSAATHTLVRSPAWVVQPGALRRFAAVFVAGGFAGMIAGGSGAGPRCASPPSRHPSVSMGSRRLVDELTLILG